MNSVDIMLVAYSVLVAGCVVSVLIVCGVVGVLFGCGVLIVYSFGVFRVVCFNDVTNVEFVNVFFCGGVSFYNVFCFGDNDGFCGAVIVGEFVGCASTSG